jgi:hypothetical protein
MGTREEQFATIGSSQSLLYGVVVNDGQFVEGIAPSPAHTRIVKMAQNPKQVVFEMLDLIDGPGDTRNAQIEVVNQILGFRAVIARNLKRPLQQTGVVGKEHILVRSSAGFGVRKRHIVWLYLLKGSLKEESDMATSDIRELLTFAVLPANFQATRPK